MAQYKAGRCLLADIRKKRGMSQEVLAELCNISRSHISSLERKKYVVTIEQGKNISSVLNCQIEDLYDWVKISE